MKISKIIESKRFMVFVSFVGLYLLSTGASWAVFSFLRNEPAVTSQDVSEGRGRIDPNLPKTEECPINGQMYSEPERQIWEGRRPITAIIENHEEARPQSGLSRADVVYEAVAEGGITRFLSVFYCGASAEDIKIAPIRSIRVYFIDWASEYADYPLLVHSGGANNICKDCPGGVKSRGQVAPEVDAFTKLVRLGWRAPNGNAMDAGTNLGFPAVKRDQYRLGEKAAWEHSFEGYTDKIFEEAEKRGFGYKNEDGDPWDEDYVSWLFKDGSPSPNPEASNISLKFWEGKGEYDVSWKYDTGQNKYLRSNGGSEHTDHETGGQLVASNVVVQYVKETGSVDKEHHMFYTTTGTGDALVFQNGGVTEATWKKPASDSRTRFFDTKGQEIEFVRGPIWIEAVPIGSSADY